MKNRPLSALISSLGALPLSAGEILRDGALKPDVSRCHQSPDQALNSETRLECLPGGKRPFQGRGGYCTEHLETHERSSWNSYRRETRPFSALIRNLKS